MERILGKFVKPDAVKIGIIYSNILLFEWLQGRHLRMEVLVGLILTTWHGLLLFNSRSMLPLLKLSLAGRQSVIANRHTADTHSAHREDKSGNILIIRLL